MGIFENDFIKLAAEKFDSNADIEFIKKVQENPNDPLAWRRAKMRFTPLIADAVRQANMSSSVAPETLMAYSMDVFKKAVLNCDTSKANKPSTYIRSMVDGELRHLSSASFQDGTRMAANLGEMAPLVHLSKTDLISKGFENPTPEQIHQNMQTTFGNKNKNYKPSQIERLNTLSRNHYSANMTMGEEDVGENIELGDISFVGKTDGETFLQRQRDKESLNKAMSILTPQERDLFSEAHGYGEYEGKGKPSMAGLAFNNNLSSPAEAKKKLAEISSKMRKELNIDGL